MNTDFRTTTLGYPRLGAQRQYKQLLESFWRKQITEEELQTSLQELEVQQLRTQQYLGVELICCGDFSPYDHVLDVALCLGCVPERFGIEDGFPTLTQYFTLARGTKNAAALEMTKWFNTNYHYLVPELPRAFRLLRNPIREALRRGEQAITAAVKPWILGPFTFLRLAKLQGPKLAARLPELTDVYRQMLDEAKSEAIALVQIDEPALVTDVSEEEWSAVQQCYQALAEAGVPLCLQTYYGDVAHIWKNLIQLPVAALGIDFVAGRQRNLDAMASIPFPANKQLVAGIVDGRNVWRSNLPLSLQTVQQLADQLTPERLLLAPSSSLLHLPETVQPEKTLPEELRSNLCFAQERLQELVLLAQAARHGKDSVADAWEQVEVARERWLHWTERHSTAVSERVRQLQPSDATRLTRQERKRLQEQRLQLPLMPTTTIGSFPQTDEIRRARVWPAEAQDIFMQGEIARVIAIQEAIGLDVLVHGEAERSDMVYFFGERLPGCATLTQGWVQSYGSRCVRPPIIYGDISRQEPLTVEISRFAQSLTKKPVKGMLTGPITVLCWSFVREDVSREQVAFQLALAVRDEAVALEQEAKLAIIQIDEPALREGLPLKTQDQPSYLNWATYAFRLATSGVSAQTQIHTHMCYCEFGDILPTIIALDADVISIENARSHGETLKELNAGNYPGEVGPGVWDIHSPEVPSIEFVAESLRQTLECLPAKYVWVNPDCGLKTRNYKEVILSLKNMVTATHQIRAEL